MISQNIISKRVSTNSCIRYVSVPHRQIEQYNQSQVVTKYI